MTDIIRNNSDQSLKYRSPEIKAGWSAPRRSTGGYGRRSVVGMTRWRAISDTVGEEDQDGTGCTVPEA